MAQQKKEQQQQRQFDKNTNKFKEDVKYDNFKKHVVGMH